MLSIGYRGPTESKAISHRLIKDAQETLGQDRQGSLQADAELDFLTQV